MWQDMTPFCNLLWNDPRGPMRMRLNIARREQQRNTCFCISALCTLQLVQAVSVVGVTDIPRPAVDPVVTQSVHCSFTAVHVQSVPRSALWVRKRPIMSAGVTLPADQWLTTEIHARRLMLHGRASCPLTVTAHSSLSSVRSTVWPYAAVSALCCSCDNSRLWSRSSCVKITPSTPSSDTDLVRTWTISYLCLN